MLYLYDLKKQKEKVELSSLNPTRFRRAGKFSDKALLDNFLKAEYLTNNVLDEAYGNKVQIIGNSGEKPFLDKKNLFFSRSSDENNLVIYISNTVCGVDIKKVGEPDIYVEKYFYTKEEQAFLNSLKDHSKKALFYTIIWTIKESIIKTTGKGLEDDLLKINTNLKYLKISESKKPLLDNPLLINGYYIYFYLIDDFVISICNTTKMDLIPTINK